MEEILVKIKEEGRGRCNGVEFFESNTGKELQALINDRSMDMFFNNGQFRIQSVQYAINDIEDEPTFTALVTFTNINA